MPDPYVSPSRCAYLRGYENEDSLRVSVSGDLVFLQIGRQYETAEFGASTSHSFTVSAEIAVSLQDVINKILIQATDDGTQITPLVPAENLDRPAPSL